MESNFAVLKNTLENELEFGCVPSLVKCHSFHRYKTNSSLSFRMWFARFNAWIVYNYLPKGRWIVVDIYRDAKLRGIYPPLFTDPEEDSCFSIYQIRWIKKCCFNFSSETFAKQRAIFLSVRKTVNIHAYSEWREPIKTRENCYPLIW